MDCFNILLQQQGTTRNTQMGAKNKQSHRCSHCNDKYFAETTLPIIIITELKPIT